MPNEVKWLVPQRVVFFSLEGELSNAEFIRANDKLAALIEVGEAPVHLIGDITKMTRPTMDIQWIARKTAIQDEKVGLVLTIGANTLIKFIAQMVKNLTKANVHLVNSMEEAHALLREKDSTIPPL